MAVNIFVRETYIINISRQVFFLAFLSGWVLHGSLQNSGPKHSNF